MTRNIFSRIIAFFLFLNIVLGSLSVCGLNVNAQEEDIPTNYSEITPIEYAALQVFCDHLGWECNASNYSRYENKTVKNISSSYGIGNGYISYSSNTEMRISCKLLFEKYINDYVLEKIYLNPESGFLAMALKHPDNNQHVLAFAASNGFDNLVDKDAVITIIESIAKILFGTASVQNEAVLTLSATFAYCFGKDWGENDFPLYYDNHCGGQVNDAFGAYEDLRGKVGEDCKISATGHSLGASLALLVSTKYNIHANTFDSIPLLDVSYYRLTKDMSENFRGYDKWDYVDYINETDVLAGTWEKQYKNHVLCADRTDDLSWGTTLESLWPTYKTDLSVLEAVGLLEKFENTFVKLSDSVYTCCNAHDMPTILAYSKDTDEFRLTDYSSYNVSERESWKKNMGIQTLEFVEDSATPSRTMTRKLIKKVLETVTTMTNKTNNGNYVILGKSSSDTLYGENNANCYDTIYGGDGDDSIYAKAGNDIIAGNKGDDILCGDYGDDTYLYWKGDGNDKIYDAGGNDKITLYGFSDNDYPTVTDNSENNTFEVNINGNKIIEISKTRTDGSNIDISVNYTDGTSKTISIGDFVYSKDIRRITVTGDAITGIFDEDGKLLKTFDSNDDISEISSSGEFHTYIGENGKDRILSAEISGNKTIVITSKSIGTISYCIEEYPESGTHVTYTRKNILAKKGSVITAKTNEYSVLSDYDGKGNPLTLGLNKAIETELQKIVLNYTKLTLYVNQTQQLTAKVVPEDASTKKCTWSSSDPSVATVDKKGNVLALKSGTTEIMVFFEDGVYEKCTVTVEAKNLYLNSNQEKMRYNSKLTLTATISEDTGYTVVWSSSDENVATVSPNGEVTAKGIGNAVIYAKTIENDYCDSCEITVYYTWWQKIIHTISTWILSLFGTN